MNKLISISNTAMSGQKVNTVNARELHLFLESRRDFSNWIRARISQYGFAENSDYLLNKIVEQLPSGAKHKIDYHLTIDMAKELAMVDGEVVVLGGPAASAFQ